jgi:hypothetical protein
MHSGASFAGMLHWSCAWRCGRWGSPASEVTHSDIHAACLARIVAFSSSTRGSMAAVTHWLHMSAALPHVKQV